jgi:hypothetical protein
VTMKMHVCRLNLVADTPAHAFYNLLHAHTVLFVYLAINQTGGI